MERTLATSLSVLAIACSVALSGCNSSNDDDMVTLKAVMLR